MEIKFTARHFKATPELQQEAIDNARNFEKFYDNIIDVEIVLSPEAGRENLKAAEFIVYVQDHTVIAKETTDDYYKSLHAAAEKVVRQLRKLKTKATKNLHNSIETNPSSQIMD